MNAYIDYKGNSSGKNAQYNEYIDKINNSNSKNTTDLLSSNEELNEKLCDAINSQTEAINDGLQSISNEIENLSYNVEKVNDTLNWGFTETLIQLGHLNDNLEELKLIMRSFFVYNYFFAL